MRSLRDQFILSHVLPFILILPIAGLVILYLIETQITLVRLSNDLEERASLIAEAVARQPDVLANRSAAERFLTRIEPLIDAEVYLLDANGTLLAADPDLTEPPNPALVSTGGALPADVRVAVSYRLSGAEGEGIAPVIDVNEQIIGLVGVRESLSGVAGSLGALRRLVIYTILGGVVLGALAGVLLARRLERPISRTSAAVAGIAAGGKADAVPVEGPRELRQLSEAVNTLSARLRLLEEMRRRSFANIVHELGRPLGALLAATQVLQGDAGDDPAVRAELLEGIHKELSGMEPLLGDLSQLHADASGVIRLDRQVVAASQWLAGALPPWREVVTAAGLSWSAEIPEDLPEIHIDIARMTQVLGNLLSNAVRYTTEGGVTVSADSGLHEISIAVADTGPGIAAADRPRIFEPFYRGATPQRTTEGLGVGLSIARSLTEAHGGRLTLDSVSLDSAPGGSVFTIHLPLAG